MGLVVDASSAPDLGQFVATVVGDTGQSTTDMDVWINVLPPALPPDGPAPACTAGDVELISLMSITPDPIAWKKAHPDRTSDNLGIQLPDGTRGLVVEFADPDPFAAGPVSPDTAMVTFTNNMSWPMQVHTTDSRTCASSAATLNIPGNSTASFSFSAATATSLVIADSVCPNIFCGAFGVGLGIQDVATFSEGNFWPLFGGRQALNLDRRKLEGPAGARHHRRPLRIPEPLRSPPRFRSR